MNKHYNKELKNYANDLRNNSVSRAEKYLWKAGLRKKQLGVSFKRQRPIDKFIVDFFSAEIDLIIEVDGSSHSFKGSYDFADGTETEPYDGSSHSFKGSYDRYRQNRLESLGYTVIRFQEGEVLHRYPDVESEISRAVEVLKSRNVMDAEENPPP